ncbi:Fasciclin domain-containing protein [Flavobacterium fluvii]|uniref:Fasciclin domain-containing protein n=1 Tax=Flavobacterium fluvii TaxID=468056 RepID=A0A1M5K2X7_9FLAO|nr:fasciclin domain-containing protein [Flavobacterium fluvii]SHG47101.1 Fasciclin domain-containing protein [Flavobacterium fluvii]
MKKKIHYYLFVLPLLALFASCSQELDPYYERPAGLEDPIYQQLEARGNFKSLTALIQKAGYKDILSKAGYWTMMAPNDEAFTKFFQEKGFSDVSKVDSITAAKIVKFALIYNAFREEKLSDYQSSKGWVVDNAYRRRTAFYDGFQSKIVNGQPKVIVGTNRNGSALYVAGDNNNKYVTYFTNEYFASKRLSAGDFNYFYPTAEYTGFNVLDSKVTEADIIAENGVIHELDKVNLPPLNIDQYLEQNPNYSLFRDVIEKNLVRYDFNQQATTAYRNYTKKTDDVFVKMYDPTLKFAPNNENYMKAEDNDGQADAYTMIVPENAAFQTFVNTVLLKNYSAVEKLPIYVFQDLVNAHMVQSAVWPTLKDDYVNALGEELKFDFNTDITDKKVLSNGFFYGANKVQKSNLFYSVYTSAYLDPKYTYATKIFNEGSGYKEMISNINKKYTIFLPSDDILRSLGYSFDSIRGEWRWVNPANGTATQGTGVKNQLLRLFYNCIVQTPKGELDNIATTSGIIRTGDEELPGEYIKWSNNKIYAAGNFVPIASGGAPAVNVIGKEVQQNGIAYYVDRFPEFSLELQGKAIERLAATNTEFDAFFQYLKNSTIYTASTGKIEGVALGSSYTFIVPNKAAIARAVAAKVLPASPLAASQTQGEKDLVADFIRYHIINNKTVSNDGFITGQQETLRKDTKGDKTYVEVTSAAGTLSFKDNSGNNAAAKFILASSNNLADRSLIHLVDNYLLP